MAKTDKTNVEAAQWNKNFQQHNQELVLLEAMAEVLGLTYSVDDRGVLTITETSTPSFAKSMANGRQPSAMPLPSSENQIQPLSFSELIRKEDLVTSMAAFIQKAMPRVQHKVEIDPYSCKQLHIDNQDVIFDEVCKRLVSKAEEFADEKVKAKTNDTPSSSSESTPPSGSSSKWKVRIQKVYDDMTSTLWKYASYVSCFCAILFAIVKCVEYDDLESQVMEYGIIKPVLMSDPKYRDVIISLDSVVQKKKSPQEIVEKLNKDRKEAVK